MKRTSEPYTIELAEAAWVAKALSTDDSYRVVLTMAALAYLDGAVRMSERTNIEWCDATLNLWWGCTKVSDPDLRIREFPEVVK